MEKKLFIMLSFMVFIACGCSSLLPSTKTDTGSRWESFDEAKKTFDKIVPYKTTAGDLNAMGLDPLKTPNMEVLTYLDIIQRFMPHPSITADYLDKGLQDCISAKDCCRAREFTLREIKKERRGNVFLDFFKFKRKTSTSGWEFQPLIVMKDDLVVYKMWSGKPNINETVEENNPLGPLQNSGELLSKLASDMI